MSQSQANAVAVSADHPALPAGATSAVDLATASDRVLRRWMFQFLRPVAGLAAVACCYLVIQIVVEIYTLRVTGNTIDHVKLIGQHPHPRAAEQGLFRWLVGRHDPDAAALLHLLLLLFMLVSMMALVRYLREVQVMRFSMNMVYGIRESVYNKLQHVGFGFHDAISSGQLINRALSDLQNVRAFVQSAVLMTLEIVLVTGGYIILILSMNPWVAALALLPLPVWTFYIVRFNRRVQPIARAVLEAEDKSVQVVTENIAGVHVVKAFSTQDQEREKYQAAITNLRQRVFTRVRLSSNFQPVIRLISSFSHLSLFFVAGSIIITTHGSAMQIGDLVVLGGAMGAMLTRLQQVATINEQYQNALVSARRLYEVIGAPVTVPERADARPLSKNGNGSVRFDNVTFGYSPDRPVLQDISFDVPGGSIVAVVGPTGAGKSSLVSLISRFYDPQGGSISIDGDDLRDLKLAPLRSQVSYVFQETYLFSDTVAANIAYGRPGITRGEIEAAARLAQAHDFIENLPQGYETLLGERGANLSGGQRQRLAIARAIVTNPRVLILDDATASVDPQTEDLIRRGMRLTLFGRTTFVIAHRISTVKNADVVLVIEEGRLTQVGTHEQLLASAGHYREIARSQLSDDQISSLDEAPSHMDRLRSPRAVGIARNNITHESQDDTDPSA